MFKGLATVAKGLIKETVKEVCVCAYVCVFVCTVRDCAYMRLRIHVRGVRCLLRAQRTRHFVTPRPLPPPQAGRQVRQSVERQRDLQPERSEEVPVCDAHSGRPRRKIAELSVTVKQCRGLPASSYENAGTVGNTDSYCVVKV
jgi:hypothetical protein